MAHRKDNRARALTTRRRRSARPRRGSGGPGCRSQRPRPQLQPLTVPTAPVTASTSAAVTSHSAYSAGRSRCQRPQRPRPRLQPHSAYSAGVSAHSVHVRGCNLSQCLQRRCQRPQRPRPQLQPLTALQRRSKPVTTSRESTWTAAAADRAYLIAGVSRSRSRRATSHSAYSAGVSAHSVPVRGCNLSQPYSAGHSFEAGVSAHGVDLVTAATADRAYLVAGHSVPVRSCNLPQRLQHRSQRPRPQLQPLTAPTAPVEAGVSVQGVDLDGGGG